MDSKLDSARIDPLPDLVVHLAGFEVTLKGRVAPAPDLDVAPVDLQNLVDHPANPHSEAESEAPEADLEKHVAALERVARVIHRAHDAGVGELVVAQERASSRPGPVRMRRTGRLGGQGLAVVVDAPARLARPTGAVVTVEVERLVVQLVERPARPGIA